ncbi:MAG: acetylglutamate kinase [Phycisphaerales bacterium]|nr:acetylglutamate kinase [Phycisphaerales bacterium]
MTGPIVIKLGGRALDEADTRGELWDAIARLGADAPGGLVIVHGGGGAVDAHLARLGLASERRAGLRVTPDDHIGEVVGVLRGRVNTRLVGLLAARGVRAVGLGLSDGGACVCVKHEPGGVDLGRVGRVEAERVGAGDAPAPGEGALWRRLLGGGFVPVISSIGLDGAGAALNVNADDAALGVARVLGASVLVLLTDVPGILDGSGSLLGETDAGQIERLIASGVISGGMIPKARAAAAGADASGVPAVIASWSRCDRLAGLALGEPVGTRVLPTRPTPVGPGR